MPIIPALMIASTSQYPALGLVAATTAAFFWSISVVLYRRVGRVMPPVRLNMSKGWFAVILLSGVVAVDYLVLGNQPWTMPIELLALMALSGVVGIAVGDTMFFAGLNRIGARRVLLIFTINPAITVVVAWMFLGEPLSWLQMLGIVLTCGGVAWVIAERNAGKTDGHVDALGVLLGIGAASCQAAGILMSRYAFDNGEMTEAASAWMRLGAAAVVLVCFLPFDQILSDPGGEAHHHPEHPSKTAAVIMFFVALLLGTVGGIWLMQIAIKQSDKVGIASTLLSTSPLFVLPIAAMLGEHISKRAIFGALICIAGVALLYVYSS